MQMRDVDLWVQLSVMMDQDNEFRDIQEPVLRAIIRQQSVVVAIMVTGGGKSLLFMLFMLSASVVTVVILSLT
jgi:superfamily II DNA helicase RecQ